MHFELRWLAAAGVTILIVMMMGLLIWLAGTPRPDAIASPSPAQAHPPLRIGLIPERDVFQQRQRFEPLADYLAQRLDRPVQLVTNRSYLDVLLDLENEWIDAAFMGSFVTVLAMDRLQARVLLKPHLATNGPTYRGILIVPQDSPLQSVTDLAGRSVAMVRATTGGGLFAIAEMNRLGMFDETNPPRIVWVGTHDDVLREVLAGNADAGALKDTRLAALLRSDPEVKVRQLAASDPVPENALVLRHGFDNELAEEIRTILFAMADDPAGAEVLQRLGVSRYRACEPAEYEPIYRMVQSLGDRWALMEVPGPAPRPSAVDEPEQGGPRAAP